MKKKLVQHIKTRISYRDRYDQMEDSCNNKPVDARWGIHVLVHAMK